MKIGDFGTSGTSTTHYRVKKKGSAKATCKIFMYLFGILFLISFIVSFFVERYLNSKLETLKNVENEAILLHDGENGINQMKNSNYNGYDGQIVVLTDVDVAIRDQVFDSDFDLEFPTALQVNRKTEYCQWEEHSVETERKVGENDKGEDIMEVETNYFYTKNWRPYLVNSFFFHDSVSYNNPSRDPFPSYTTHSKAQIGEMGDFLVDGSHLKRKKRQTAPVPHNLMPTPYMESVGDSLHDGTYIYSKIRKGTIRNIVEKGLGYFFEGVIDIGFEGKCTPGDVRVHFEVEEYYPKMSLAARISLDENDGMRHLVPFSIGKKGGEIFLSSQGRKTLKELSAEFEDSVWSQIYVVRGISITFLVLFLIFWFLNFRSSSSSSSSYDSDGKKMD